MNKRGMKIFTSIYPCEACGGDRWFGATHQCVRCNRMAAAAMRDRRETFTDCMPKAKPGLETAMQGVWYGD